METGALEELVDGDGYISDDSSFYGAYDGQTDAERLHLCDTDNQQQLTLLCKQYDTRQFWTTYKKKKDLNAIVTKRRTMPPPDLINPSEGRMDSWQLGESAEAFVKRLSPLAPSSLQYEWIWVQNPFPSTNTPLVRDNTCDFVARGQQVLEESLRKRRDIRSRAVTGQLNKEAELLQQRITDIAVEANILSGKWMLFPGSEDITRVWRLVVDGVINNRLGCTAKVAPDEGKEGDRLICIYTHDFRDKNDILRVLKELISMGLVNSGSSSRPIYYKSDIYTLLGIYGQNAAEYGLQASLFTSHKILADTQNGLFAPCDAMDID